MFCAVIVERTFSLLDILERTRTSLCKQKCKQRDFLVNAADLIGKRDKINEETLFCLMSSVENCFILTYLLCFSTRVHKNNC